MAKDRAASEDLGLEDLGNRLVAARSLRGWDQAKVQGLMKPAGLPYSQLSDLENGKVPFPPIYRNGMAEILQVPRRWFYAPLSELVGERPEPSLAGRLASIDQQLEELPKRLLESVDQLLQGPEQANPSSGEESDPTQKPEEGKPPAAEGQA